MNASFDEVNQKWASIKHQIQSLEEAMAKNYLLGINMEMLNSSFAMKAKPDDTLNRLQKLEHQMVEVQHKNVPLTTKATQPKPKLNLKRAITKKIAQVVEQQDQIDTKEETTTLADQDTIVRGTIEERLANIESNIDQIAIELEKPDEQVEAIYEQNPFSGQS